MPSSANIGIGRYHHRHSPIHRLDPRAKLLAFLILIVSVFLARSLLSFLTMASLILGIIFLSRIPLLLILRGLRLVVWILISILGLHIFLANGNFGFTWQGVYNGIMVSCQFMLIVIGATVLTSATIPLRLADGIASLIRPLRKIGFPAHQFPIMVIIILHFIPTLLEEGEKLISVQKSRGNEPGSRKVFGKLKALVPIFMPLLKSSFRSADEVAMGMESRCYSGGVRTHMNELSFRLSDGFAMILSAALIPLILMMNELHL